MIETWSLRYPAVGGEEERRAYLYLPTMYKTQPERRFPVLYMFDGQNVFFDQDATYGKSWGLGEYLDYTDTPLIVAAVACNTGCHNERLTEYTPYPFQDAQYGSFAAGGRETLGWYARQLKPLLDQNLRTLPDPAHTFLAGSSMGGLMSLYGLLAWGHVFGRAAALSPSIWVAPDKLLALAGRAKAGQVLYMDYGQQEMAGRTGMRRDFGALCGRLMERGVQLTGRIVPGGQHNETSWQRQLPFAIETLMYGLPEL